MSSRFKAQCASKADGYRWIAEILHRNYNSALLGTHLLLKVVWLLRVRGVLSSFLYSNLI